jgi:hypothetical protein
MKMYCAVKNSKGMKRLLRCTVFQFLQFRSTQYISLLVNFYLQIRFEILYILRNSPKNFRLSLKSDQTGQSTTGTNIKITTYQSIIILRLIGSSLL